MQTDLIGLTADITAAHVAHNDVSADQVPDLISSVYGALEQLGKPAEDPEPVYEPAVSVRSSVKHDHIISLIDGQPYKMLKRHLGLHGLTPDEYRERYGLKPDYPMVAPSYSEKRRDLAKKIGLGKPENRRKAA